MDDLDCGPHVLTFKSGSVMASVNISLVNDDVPECDETFKAHIIIDNVGNSTGQGLRLGPQNSIDITVKDEGMWLCISGSLFLSVMHGLKCVDILSCILSLDNTGSWYKYYEILLIRRLHKHRNLGIARWSLLYNNVIRTFGKKKLHNCAITVLFIFHLVNMGASGRKRVLNIREFYISVYTEH